MCAGSIQNKSHTWPSKSSNPQLYIKPWSSGSLTFRAPNANALSESRVTSSLLSHDKDMSTSVVDGSAIGFERKFWNFASSHNMAYILLPIIMHVESSLVNCGLKLNPRPVKKSTDFLRFLMGRFRKIAFIIDTTLLNPEIKSEESPYKPDPVVLANRSPSI